MIYIRKLFIITIVFIVFFSLSSCSKDDKNNVTIPDDVVIREVPDETFTVIDEEIYISGAAIYRGEVINIDADFYTYTLEQYPGANYGSSTLNVVFKSNTRTSVDPSTLENGDYIEVFYNQSENSESVDALGANNLHSAESHNFNGKIFDIVKDPENEKHGKLVMYNMSETSETTFWFENDGGTQFYLNFDDLQRGDEINIFHSGIKKDGTNFILAEEIRPYFHVEKEDGE